MFLCEPDLKMNVPRPLQATLENWVQRFKGKDFETLGDLHAREGEFHSVMGVFDFEPWIRWLPIVPTWFLQMLMSNQVAGHFAREVLDQASTSSVLPPPASTSTPSKDKAAPSSSSSSSSSSWNGMADTLMVILVLALSLFFLFS
jgi:hypothetical protein